MRALVFLCLAAALLHAADLRVPVTVTPDDPPLKPPDFRAMIEGAGDANIVGVRAPSDDLLLMVVMDTVGDLSYVEPARRALAERFAELPPRTHVTLLQAQDGLRVVSDPTGDAESLANSLASIPIAGKSALLDTVETASRVAEAVALKSNVRVAILYITDSDVRNYREDFTNPVINSSDSRDLSRRFPEGLIRERISRLSTVLSEFQTPIFIVHLRPAPSGNRLDEAYQTGLLQLANVTGGEAWFCRTGPEIPNALQQAVNAISGQYRVHIQLPPKIRKNVVLTLQAPDRQLSYRRTFVFKQKK